MRVFYYFIVVSKLYTNMGKFIDKSGQTINGYKVIRFDCWHIYPNGIKKSKYVYDNYSI